jgi:small conductance mechanosensitive channel
VRSLTTPEVRERAAHRARRAWRELAVLVPLVTGVLLVYTYRIALFGVDTPVRVLAGIALVILGWVFARAVGRLVAPILTQHNIDTAGPAGFLIRLLTIGTAVVVALRIVGLDPTALAAGSAVTAIILGLAAQQTLGNLFAGVVLLSAHPFGMADRVRLQSGGVGGQVDGVVVGLGLLYTTLARGQDKILVPNSVVLNSAVVPLREPAAVDVRFRLKLGTKPTELQGLLDQTLTTPLRSPPHIGLEEVAGDEIVVRITATPANDDDGPKLANEVLAVLGQAASKGQQSSPP